MLTLLLAIGAAATTLASADGPAVTTCVPSKYTLCVRPAKAEGKWVLPLGKRCNPDPTKAVGCRERQRD